MSIDCCDILEGYILAVVNVFVIVYTSDPSVVVPRLSAVVPHHLNYHNECSYYYDPMTRLILSSLYYCRQFISTQPEMQYCMSNGLAMFSSYYCVELNIQKQVCSA